MLYTQFEIYKERLEFVRLVYFKILACDKSRIKVFHAPHLNNCDCHQNLTVTFLISVCIGVLVKMG